MYEVIISTINTGKVRRKVFATWDEANQHANDWLDQQAARKKKFSARDYRVEIQQIDIEVPAVRKLAKAKRQKVAA